MRKLLIIGLLVLPATVLGTCVAQDGYSHSASCDGCASCGTASRWSWWKYCWNRAMVRRSTRKPTYVRVMPLDQACYGYHETLWRPLPPCGPDVFVDPYVVSGPGVVPFDPIPSEASPLPLPRERDPHTEPPSPQPMNPQEYEEKPEPPAVPDAGDGIDQVEVPLPLFSPLLPRRPSAPPGIVEVNSEQAFEVPEIREPALRTVEIPE